MKKAFIIYSDFNDIGVAFRVDEKDYKKAVDLAHEGFFRWNNPEVYPEYQDMGYSEPSELFLKGAGIEYDSVDLKEWMADELHKGTPEWCSELIWF